MAHTIDTLKIFDDLKQSFTEEQAHKLSVVIQTALEGSLDALSTKQDIADLTITTQQAIVALKHDIEVFRVETKRDLQALELRLKNDLQQVKYDLTMRMGAMLAASIGIITALIKLL
jgi:hypothetical protein